MRHRLICVHLLWIWRRRRWVRCRGELLGDGALLVGDDALDTVGRCCQEEEGQRGWPPTPRTRSWCCSPATAVVTPSRGGVAVGLTRHDSRMVLVGDEGALAATAEEARRSAAVAVVDYKKAIGKMSVLSNEELVRRSCGAGARGRSQLHSPLLLPRRVQDMFLAHTAG